MSNKFVNIKERILYVLELKGIVKKKFIEEKLCMTYGNFTGKAKETPLNSDAIENVLLEITDLNGEWLLTGKGEVFKTEEGNSLVGNIIAGSKKKIKNVDMIYSSGGVITNKNKNDETERNNQSLSETKEVEYLKNLLNEKDKIIEEKERFIQSLLEIRKK